VVAALLSVLLNAVTACGQSSSAQTAPSTTASSVAESVAIYITAATKKGVPVIDLKPDDLTITEDKVPTKIEKISCGKPDPILLGVLVDVSGSRRFDPYLGSHYDALQAFLDQALRDHDAAYVVTFDDRPHKLSGLTADRGTLTAAFDELKKYKPQGPTALYDTIKAAANANFFGHTGRRLLLVVGDWEDNSSHIRLDQVAQFPERTSTTVYAIVDAIDSATFSKKGHSRALSAVKKVTEETGGLYYDVQGEKELAAALQAILGAIGGACRVDYSVPNLVPNKKGIKLHVEANSKETSVDYPKVRFAVAE